MITRSKYNFIKDHIDTPEISIISGPRQAGKTTIMKQLQAELAQKQIPTSFFNLDADHDKQYFQSQDILLEKIRIEHGDQKAYIFIDEMQRHEYAGLFLKGLYDMKLPYRFIVSGSGSIDLKSKIPESMAGRKRMFYIFPLNFLEFADYKTAYKYTNKLPEYFILEPQKTKLLLEEYLHFGGYPKVVTASTRQEKYETMQEIFTSYRDKDISSMLRLQNIDGFVRMLHTIAHQIGHHIVMDNLTKSAGINIRTLKNILYFSERTYFTHPIRPYFQNKRKELAKAPMIYFHDVGMSNFAAGVYGRPHEATHMGVLFQSLVFQILYQQSVKTHVNLRYWRTKDQSEVDFVLEDGKDIIPIEVKYSDAQKTTLPRGFHNFLKRYTPKVALMITRTHTDKIQVGETTVYFFPFWKLHAIDFRFGIVQSIAEMET